MAEISTSKRGSGPAKVLGVCCVQLEFVPRSCRSGHYPHIILSSTGDYLHTILKPLLETYNLLKLLENWFVGLLGFKGAGSITIACRGSMVNVETIVSFEAVQGVAQFRHSSFEWC